MNKIISEKEIADLEKKLALLKAERDAERKAMLEAIHSDSFLSSLSKGDLVGLMRRIQHKIVGPHKKVRGSRVPEDLKSQLMDAIKNGEYSLSQLGEIFNLSISYISRIKKEMRDDGKLFPVLNGYEDRQLTHHQGAA